jgi:hypothetical protein
MKFNIPNQDKIALAIENGAVLHVLDPATGLPGYRDGDEKKPMRVKMRSYRAKSFQDYQFKQQAVAAAKAKVSRAKTGEPSEQFLRPDNRARKFHRRRRIG